MNHSIEDAKANLPVYGFLKFHELLIPKPADIEREILKLKQEKNALVLSQFSQSERLKRISDFVGNSLSLIKKSVESSEAMIAFCGVRSLAETVKILCPEKKIVMPDLFAGSALLRDCSATDMKNLRKEHPEAIIVSYIQSSVEVKAESDLTVAGSNAKKILRSLPKGKEIIFAPDVEMANFLTDLAGRSVSPWQQAPKELYSAERNTLEKLYLCLRYDMPEIEIEEQLRKRAEKPLQKMLDLSQDIPAQDI